ncbi:MAG: TrbC/VirB2 family protein [Patescibacteria group bacterium]
MTAIKNHLLRTSAIAFVFITNATNVLAINIGEVPGGLASSGTIESTVTDVVVGLLKLMALVATIVIIIAGVRMVVSQGEDAAIEKSKKTIIWAIVGLILILLAGAIVSFVKTAAGI